MVIRFYNVEVNRQDFSQVDKMGGKREAELRGDKFYGLEIVCKDVRTLRFMMSKGHGDPIRCAL